MVCQRPIGIHYLEKKSQSVMCAGGSLYIQTLQIFLNIKFTVSKTIHLFLTGGNMKNQVYRKVIYIIEILLHEVFM